MILIKQMDKPESCAECRLKDYTFNECKVMHKNISSYGVLGDYPLPKWCPLIEVEEYGPEGMLYKVK